MTVNQSKVCRSCGTIGLKPILSLGRTPLANALLTSDQLNEVEDTYPLDLAFCDQCCLVQITETVSAETLFREYFYLSSFSDTMLRHAQNLAHQLIESRQLGPNSLVIEVASNDGYLLRNYKREGIPVLGIEPATNIAQVAEQQHGIPTICEFFGEQLAERLDSEGHRADVIHASNVLAHVADLNGFVRGLSRILKDNGVVVIEVPYVKDMVDRCEFDTIYHEHLSYFSLTSLSRLFQKHGLVIHKVEQLTIHGGTLRVYLHHDGSDVQVNPTTELLMSESSWACDFGFYSDFGTRVEQLKLQLVDLLRGLKERNQRVAAYGASAKGSTLLNYCGIGRDMLDYVVDRSTVKQGFYTPGTHLLIYPPEKLLEDEPEFVLLLTWNFVDEILQQQSEYRRRGGRFIVPIPDVKLA